MSALTALAVQIGTPLIRAALQRRFGDDGRLAADVTDALARRLKVEPAALDDLAVSDPPRVIDAMREVERAAPEIVALYASEVEQAAALARAEQGDPLWVRAWRPAGMYLIGFLWLWNVVLLHVGNAIWKTALPPVPFGDLLHLSGLYMGLYMGGHTVKDLAEKWRLKG